MTLKPDYLSNLKGHLSQVTQARLVESIANSGPPAPCFSNCLGLLVAWILNTDRGICICFIFLQWFAYKNLLYMPDRWASMSFLIVWSLMAGIFKEKLCNFLELGTTVGQDNFKKYNFRSHYRLLDSLWLSEWDDFRPKFFSQWSLSIFFFLILTIIKSKTKLTM